MFSARFEFVGAADVVTVTVLDAAETLPWVSFAVTANWYVVEADRPVTVNVVELVVPTEVVVEPLICSTV